MPAEQSLPTEEVRQGLRPDKPAGGHRPAEEQKEAGHRWYHQSGEAGGEP